MLQIQISPHREFLPAEAPEQKLFLMLKVRPTKEVANTRPPTNFVFVIDTSGSMYEVVRDAGKPTGTTFESDGNHYQEVTGGKSKLDLVIESLKTLLHSGKLTQSDRIAIIQFDDRASTLVELTPATPISEIENAINRLRDFSGGTRMGLGMSRAYDLLANLGMASNRTLIFTDGHTFDEDRCLELVQQYAGHNIPITALGVGEFNEDLLIKLSDLTAGRVHHVVGEQTEGTNISIQELPSQIIAEFSQAQQDVITNLALTVKTVKGVQLTRIIRAYPEQAEFSLKLDPYPIGNSTAGDETVFILEFNIESRKASRVRIAQLGLTYDIPGKNRRGEVPPQDLKIQFVAGQMGAQVDPEVMGYIQQCNIVDLLKKATQVAESNPQQAEEIFETARRITQRIGNEKMTRSIGDAQAELRKTRKISSETSKTIKIGSKGKTVRMSNDINDELSDEEIRQASGT